MKIKVAVVALLLCVGLCACTGEHNSDVGKYCAIKLPTGEIIQGRIQSLTRWNASTFDVTIDNVQYTVHPMNFACWSE